MREKNKLTTAVRLSSERHLKEIEAAFEKSAQTEAYSVRESALFEAINKALCKPIMIRNK